MSPAKSDDPLRRVTLNLYESNCQWMERHIGHGWTQWIRTTIDAEIRRLKEMPAEYKRRTLGDLE